MGFARETGSWPREHYEAIAEVCRWIERQTGCPARSMEGVSWRHPRRLGGMAFHRGRGHHGHVHVAGNDHTDPGTGFKIELILREDGSPHRTLKYGHKRADVEALQRAISLRAVRCGRPDKKVDVDGVFGPRTSRAAGWAAYILGIGASQWQIRRGGISAYVQRRIRDPQQRNGIQKRRAGIRRRKHCRN